jgi:hypothetical protein
MRAVEKIKTVDIARKMRGHPVQNDADARFVRAVNKIHQVFGIAETARRGVITRHLVTPGREIRVLGHRHQLDVGEAHFFDIRHKVFGQFAVIERTVAVFGQFFPRAGVHFIDRPRAGFSGVGDALRHPIAVLPAVFESPNHRSGARRRFPFQGVGVAFVQIDAGIRLDVVLIYGTLAKSGDKTLPNTAVVPTRVQDVRLGVPFVEIAGHRYAFGIRCPDGKVHAAFAVDLDEVASEFFINLKMFTGLKKRDIKI